MQVEIYVFSHAPGIYANMQGNFFRMSDDLPLKKIYHCKRIAIKDSHKG